jgi:hypothetical protein
MNKRRRRGFGRFAESDTAAAVPAAVKPIKNHITPEAPCQGKILDAPRMSNAALKKKPRYYKIKKPAELGGKITMDHGTDNV